jgi:hypothetical protein
MIGRLHYEIVRSLLDEGACPANAELERRLGITDAALESLIAEAAAGHALVPHPHVAEPWVVHPFSLSQSGRVEALAFRRRLSARARRG